VLLSNFAGTSGTGIVKNKHKIWYFLSACAPRPARASKRKSTPFLRAFPCCTPCYIVGIMIPRLAPTISSGKTLIA